MSNSVNGTILVLLKHFLIKCLGLYTLSTTNVHKTEVQYQR